MASKPGKILFFGHRKPRVRVSCNSSSSIFSIDNGLFGFGYQFQLIDFLPAMLIGESG